MKAVVLAAGLGTRLGPMAADRPKCMLSVGGRPLLAHILELARRHGVADVFINLHWHPAAIRDQVGDGGACGLRVHYLMEKELSGTAGPLRKLAPELRAATFLVIYGDNLTDLDLTALLETHRRSQAELTVALHREAPEDLPGKSVAETDEGGRLVRFVEKPAPGQLFSHWASAGIYAVEPSVIDLIPPAVAFDMGHDLIPALLRERRRVFGFKSDFYLLDIGTPQAYARAEADFLAGRLS